QNTQQLHLIYIRSQVFCNSILKGLPVLIYQMADCYVFPVLKEFSCIDMPLSVLEAMACNIGVITTRYQALPKIVKESEGVIFINGHSNIINIINSNLESFKIIDNRSKVLSYSWENIINMLEAYYREIINCEEGKNAASN
ncbi:MAG: glycosyltransferase family 4 protein, partial [Peptococcaceae bacterium]|nr:glycosyltransferase family 4 protein [Peptococcaceae bacterium]